MTLPMRHNHHCKAPPRRFFPELFANYDCNPEASDLLHDLVTSLCKNVFPSSGIVTGNHLLALECLTQVTASPLEQTNE